MFALVAPIAAVIAAIPGGAAADSHRNPIACGSAYTVENGDSLYEIAIRAYGSGPKFEAIFAANRDRLSSARALTVGETIEIPCLGEEQGLAVADAAGGGRANAEPAPAAPVAEAEHPVPVPAESFTLLASRAFGRLAGGDLPGGGLITELVHAALDRTAPGLDVDVVFGAEPGAQLGRLMRDGTVHAGIPWFKPDCGAPEGAGRVSRILCERFDFSEPLFEVPVAVYAGAGAPLPEHTGGKRVCLAHGHTFGLAPEMAGTPAPELQRTDSTAACFVRLIRGLADLVVAPRAEGAATIAALQIADIVREVEALAMTRSIHAVAAKDAPQARSSLARINAGMARLLESGEWFRIVVQHQSQKVALQE